MTTSVRDIVVYARGLACCSACVPVDSTREEVETGVNFHNPTGIASPWAISEDATFSGGEPNPCPCGDDETRRHWLLSC